MISDNKPLWHSLAFAALCAIWGSTWLAIRIVVRDVPPLRAAASRFLVAALLLGVVIFGRSLRWPENAGQWRALAILSVTMMALPYGLIFWAEQHISSSVTAVLYSALPLATSLLTPVMTQRRVPRAAVYASLVAVGGIAILFDVGNLQASADTFLGGVMVLVAVVSSAGSAIYAKKETGKIQPVVSTALQLFGGACVLGLLSLIFERHAASTWTPSAVIALLFLSTFGSAIAFAIYYWLLRYMDAYKIATVNLVVPFVAILEGSLVIHEMVTGMMVVAAAIVLGAVGFVLKAESDEPSQLNLKNIQLND